MSIVLKGRNLGYTNQYGVSGTAPGMAYAPNIEADRVVSDPDQIAALEFEKQKFGTLSGMLNAQLGGDASSIGGRPQIDVGPIFNPQRIQQQVNAQRAQGDQATETATRNMQQSLGSRGFGSQSPLAQALGGMYQARNLASGTEAERSTRMQAAQANAPHVLQAQTAREQALIERQKPYWQRQNVLLGALANLG